MTLVYWRIELERNPLITNGHKSVSGDRDPSLAAAPADVASVGAPAS
jgi:hypothetical protein